MIYFDAKIYFQIVSIVFGSKTSVCQQKQDFHGLEFRHTIFEALEKKRFGVWRRPFYIRNCRTWKCPCHEISRCRGRGLLYKLILFGTCRISRMCHEILVGNMFQRPQKLTRQNCRKMKRPRTYEVVLQDHGHVVVDVDYIYGKSE